MRAHASTRRAHRAVAWVAVLLLWQVTAATFTAGMVAGDESVMPGATNYNSQRKVAVAPNGSTLAVTYVAELDGTGSVMVDRSDDGGASWTTLPPLSSAPAFRPAVAFDAESVLHAAWTELAGSSRQVFYAQWAGGPDWVARLQLSDTPGYSGYPSLALDASGRVHVVWYGFDGEQYQIYYRYMSADPDRVGSQPAWSATTQATRWVRDANSPAIAVGPDEKVHVAFFTYVEGVHDVQYMSGGPGGWSTAERVNPDVLGAVQPSIVVHDNGTVAVAYVAGEDAEAAVVYSERRPEGWTEPVQVSAPGGASVSPSLAARPNHTALLAWETGDATVSFATLEAGRWSPATPLDAEAHWPSLSWATFPNVSDQEVRGEQPATYAVWTASDGDGDHLGFAELGSSQTDGTPRVTRIRSRPFVAAGNSDETAAEPAGVGFGTAAADAETPGEAGLGTQTGRIDQRLDLGLLATLAAGASLIGAALVGAMRWRRRR